MKAGELIRYSERFVQSVAGRAVDNLRKYRGRVLSISSTDRHGYAEIELTWEQPDEALGPGRDNHDTILARPHVDVETIEEGGKR